MNKLFPLKEATIYHKTKADYKKYQLELSFRQTSSIVHENVGLNSNDEVLIRIFDKDYNKKWFCDKGDFIVLGFTDYEVKEAPLTELQKQFGKDKVFKVMSVEDLFYDDDIGHLKVTCK